uniref:Uncharacterized protein n=1 Tax=Cacopsylla melanoneura TaxID=428564 RepID=A0A8D8RPB5_9HEMI
MALQDTIAILLLPFIAEVPSARKINGKHFRPSRRMMVESFVLVVDQPQQIDEVVESRRNFLISKRRTLQPFVVAVGDFRDPRSVYIIIDSTHYLLGSIKEAVDVLFKIFFATWCNFPCESEDYEEFQLFT